MGTQVIFSRVAGQAGAILTSSIFKTQELAAAIVDRRKMKVLFSPKDDWEPAIRKGFRFTGHDITFAALTPEAIKSCDLVVPLTLKDLNYLAEARSLIGTNPIPIPTTACISLCDDKLLFNRKLIDEGFNDLIPNMGTGLSFPYVLKKRVDEYGLNTHIIRDNRDELDLKDAIGNSGYFCQELIPGQKEYATHILFANQEILASLNVEYTFSSSQPIKGKDSRIIQRLCEPTHLDVFSTVLRTIGFEGLCCFNYKLVAGQPKLFEINPRFGGSLAPFFFSFIRRLNR